MACMIEDVVKEKGVMYSNSKNDHTVHTTVLCDMKGWSGLVRVWCVIDAIMAVQGSEEVNVVCYWSSQTLLFKRQCSEATLIL